MMHPSPNREEDFWQRSLKMGHPLQTVRLRSRRLVVARKTLVSVLILTGFIAIEGCHSRKSDSSPTIEFTKIPPAAQGGRERVDTIAGLVKNAHPGQQIVIYAHSGQWWVQPWPEHPFIPINADSTWSTETHLGFDYAALLVEPDYHPLPEIDVVPTRGGSVALVTIVKGTGTPQLAPTGSLKFSGYDWAVRTIESDKGGISNLYDPKNAWTDAKGALHMQITRKSDKWSCAEIFLNRTLGYGTYSVTIRDTSHLEPAAVFSMFTFDDSDSEQHFREMDLEVGGRDAAHRNNARYTIQPLYIPGNLFAFAVPTGTLTFVLNWEPGHAIFKTFRKSSADAGGQLVSEHEFRSAIPVPGKAVPRLIFYVVASDKNPMQKPSEVVVDKFEYLP
ncbi:MAG TPA: glycoside hydrolase family 16 protein [Candidatus Solibacter sp.]|nr:glycoside hydrolase family 16 protein [Candidatus Solibacter sp.]